uniref:Met-10+ like-protein n=1 Tax=Babesia bovis TaxID=5865 RepID=S6B3S5_BABBO|nr:Met-10+ like-protein [Babesia bovis]
MDLELLAGDDDLIATQNENGHTFKIDFRNVYWNSRLIRERERLSETFTRGDIVIDMFAGVGPFAIYAAGKGCLVFANDLNPTGTQYIELNAKLNKLSDKVFAYNRDARDFVKTVIDAGILDKQTTSVKDHVMKVDSKVHFVMNLPKDAIEFLDSLKGRAKGIDPENIRTCVVHCYCFSEAADVETDIDARIERVLGINIPDKKIVTVRDVSPKKHMYCIEFKIPTTLLSAGH